MKHTKVVSSPQHCCLSMVDSSDVWPLLWDRDPHASECQGQRPPHLPDPPLAGLATIERFRHPLPGARGRGSPHQETLEGR